MYWVLCLEYGTEFNAWLDVLFWSGPLSFQCCPSVPIWCIILHFHCFLVFFFILLYILSEDDRFLRARRTREVCKSGELVMELATCVILFSVILITFWVISCKRWTGCTKPPIKFVLVIILDTNFENNSGKGRRRRYRIECVVCKYVVW